MKRVCGRCLHWNQVSLGSEDGRCQAPLPAWGSSNLGEWRKFNSNLAEWCPVFTPLGKVTTLPGLSPSALNTLATRIKHDLTNLLNYSFLTKEQHDEIWDRVSQILQAKNAAEKKTK